MSMYKYYTYLYPTSTYFEIDWRGGLYFGIYVPDNFMLKFETNSPT